MRVHAERQHSAIPVPLTSAVVLLRTPRSVRLITSKPVRQAGFSTSLHLTVNSKRLSGNTVALAMMMSLGVIPATSP